MSALRFPFLLVLLVVVPGFGCHRGVEAVPLADDLLTLRDRFFDVATVDGRRVVVVGYGGKVLISDDAGERWRRAAAPTDRSLLRVALADGGRAWAVGQDGV